MNTSTTRKCSQCGSPLILVSSVVEHIDGSRFPQTTNTYRCSNQACQDEKDKQEAKRIKLKEEKEEAAKKRLEERQLQKKKILLQ